MSSASIVGLAVLETPRQVAGHGMTLQFDAQFYLAPGQKMLASLRYFNLYNQTFDDVGMYFVWANVSYLRLISIGFSALTTGFSDFYRLPGCFPQSLAPQMK